MWPNPQFSADLVTLTEEILNGKLHFLCHEILSKKNFRFSEVSNVKLFSNITGKIIDLKNFLKLAEFEYFLWYELSQIIDHGLQVYITSNLIRQCLNKLGSFSRWDVTIWQIEYCSCVQKCNIAVCVVSWNLIEGKVCHVYHFKTHFELEFANVTFNKEYDINTITFPSIKNKLLGLISLKYMPCTAK